MMKIKKFEIKKPAPSGCCPAPAGGDDKPPCCGPATVVRGGVIDENVPGFLGWLETETGRVARIAPELHWRDHFGAWKARWAIGRMTYIVAPGLYALGAPTPASPVVVTANYKMSFDLVRRVLAGRDVWLLVLETFGINVWCAAGKGSFGTEELIRRIRASRLSRFVEHRRLLLPILGAPGVAAHQVTRQTGFRVVYATIRVADLPTFLDHGETTQPAMRELSFSLYERLVLVPVELVMALKSLAVIGGILFLAGFVASGPVAGVTMLLAWLGAALTGIALVPLLLPWLPGRSFALKGMIAGLAWSALFYQLFGAQWSTPTTLAAFLALPAVSAFHALNFTGCTPFTSRSGVKKEMRRAIPAMGGALALSALLLLAARFLI